MYKYFVWDFSSEKYLPIDGIFDDSFEKMFAPCDVFIKIPFFN